MSNCDWLPFCTYLPICLPVCLSVCLPVCLSVCLSVYLSFCLSIVGSIGSHMAFNLWFKTPDSPRPIKGERSVKPPSFIKGQSAEETTRIEQASITRAVDKAVEECNLVAALVRAFGISEEEELLGMAREDDAYWANDGFEGSTLEVSE